jgi:eukaryotic-like serine/threonine-protein kinase
MQAAQVSRVSSVNHLVLGRFQVLRSLGEGGMGVLLISRDMETGRQAILKMPRMLVSKDDAAIKRFEHEIEVLRRLKHPRIPSWLADGMWAGRRVLALEHVEGLTASQLVHRRGSLVPAGAAPLVADVLAALHATHVLCADDGAPLELVHRDVSPQNIVVDASGRGNLIDFGVSTDARFDGGLDEGHVVGKVGYMAPEVVGGGRVGPATDQFAAGIVLWELITARRLFRADTERNTWKNILRCDVPRLDAFTADAPAGRRVPRELADVVARMLDPDPESRYATCADASRALFTASGELGRMRLDAADLGYARRARVVRSARTVRLRPDRSMSRPVEPVEATTGSFLGDAMAG